MYYLNDRIKSLNRVYSQHNRTGYLRLDLNENPGGLPKDFIVKVLGEVTPEMIAQYPETIGFTQTLADHIGTDASNICLFNGSSEGIRCVIEAFTSENGKIVGVTPSYAMFEVYAQMLGREFIPVQYTEDSEMPINRILDKLSSDVQLLILVNPNNPMGNTYTNEEFELILQRAHEFKITVLVDEAYHYFYPKSFIKYALQEEHVFITRTFSKLFSLAGARLGYVVGWSEGVEMIQKLCTPHNVNVFSMLLAQKIIETPDLIDDLIAKHKEGREYLQEALTKHGYEFKGEAGNFIFIKQNTDADRLVSRMKEEKRILIKTYSGIGKFGNCLRVSTAEKKYMKVFIDALLELDHD